MLSITIKSMWPPSVVSIGGKTYAMPGWIEIPAETTMEELRKCWVDTSPPPKKVIADISKDVVSTNGKKTYLVLYRNSQWTCNCVGYGFRRKCKHIDKIKNETNIR